MGNFIYSVFNDFKLTIKGVIDKKIITIIILVSCYAIGIILGFFIKPTEFIYNYCLTNAKSYYSAVMFRDASCIGILIDRIFANLGYFLIIFTLGLSCYLFPLSAIIIAYRGFILGLSINIFFSGFGLSGILIGIFLIIPQNLIATACLCLTSATSLYLRNKTKSKFILAYIKPCVILYAVSLLGGIIECLFLCLLLRPMNFFF